MLSLTDPQNIILAYRNEMFRRLQKRLIKADIKDYVSAMNQLLDIDCTRPDQLIVLIFL